MPFLGISTPQNRADYEKKPTVRAGNSKSKTQRINESIFDGCFVANGKSINLQRTLVVFFDDTPSVLDQIQSNSKISQCMPHQLIVNVNPNEIGNKNRYYYHNNHLNQRQNIDSIFDNINTLKHDKSLNNVLIITDLDGTVANTALVCSAVEDMGGLDAYERVCNATLPRTPEDYPGELEQHHEGGKSYPKYDHHLIRLFQGLKEKYGDNFDLWGLTDREVDNTNRANKAEGFRIPDIEAILQRTFPAVLSATSSKELNNPEKKSTSLEAIDHTPPGESPLPPTQKGDDYCALMATATLLLFVSAGGGAALYYFDVLNLENSIIAASAAFFGISLIYAISKGCLSKKQEGATPSANL